jgi:GNAT superfamily N-acetyltransferase
MNEVGTEADLLERIEAYFDAAPRAAADVEQHGALTLFVSRIPWRFYGRPRFGVAEDIGADDVAAVRERQRELGVREAFEWVHETTPSLAGAAAAAGLEVMRVPLLALDPERWTPAPAPAGIGVRMLGADDRALVAAQAAIELAFTAPADTGHAGRPEIEPGAAGPEARDRASAQIGDLGFLRERLRRGLTALAVAESESEGPLAAGSHQPVGTVSEVTGVGTLLAARRRGIGTALTGRLVEDAREGGAEIVFLSAAGDEIARMYERLGFRRLGTACFGYPPEP